MPEYKMIATDLDDSLLDDSFRISAENREAIFRASREGIRVVLATGRMYRSALPYALELGLDTPLITYQGAYVRPARSGEVLYHRPVPLELALEVLERLAPLGYHVNIYIDDSLLVEELSGETRIYRSISGVEAVPVGNLVDYLGRVRREPTKVLVVAPEEKINELQDKMKACFGDRLYITKSKPIFLEFMHPEATKGRALEAVAGRYGIGMENIIAVGDSYNDLDMLERAGLGVAVANAGEEIRRRAGFVTTSNNSGGVAWVIRKFIFNEGD
ncbi:MAG: Cof-type HAD-IIB family hydrolase [Bacillota bacterium]